MSPAAPPSPVTTAPGLRVEVATWRPVQVVDVDGWQVGLSAGFTRRGNSVAPLAAPADVDAALDEVERIYAEHGLRSTFRVCDDSAPSNLDDLLAERGYVVAAATQVMTAPLTSVRRFTAASAGPTSAGAPRAGAPGGADVVITTSQTPDDDWLRGWLDVKATSTVDADLARRLLSGAPASYLTARSTDGGGSDAATNGAVLGVLRSAPSGRWLALSCLMVAPQARRRGIGRLLTRAAVDAVVGYDDGMPPAAPDLSRGIAIDHAFLQVEQSNDGAVALYESLGFVVAARYHYRESDPAPPARPRHPPISPSAPDPDPAPPTAALAR